MVEIILAPNIRRVCINKTNRNKMLHLVVEINHALLEGLVDIRVSCQSWSQVWSKNLASCIWF